MNTFNAIGYFKGLNNAKLVQSFPSKTGKGEYLKLSFGVSIPEKNQTTFVTLLGNAQPIIRAQSAVSRGEQIEIKWEDRMKKESIDSVAQFAKYVFSYPSESGRVYEEFISPYDMILFAEKYFDKYVLEKKLPMRVYGKFTRNPYDNGTTVRTYNQFNIQSIYIYDEDTQIDCSTIVKAEIIYNKDSLMLDKEKNRYLISAYTNEYINKAVGQKYVPFCPVYDARKIMEYISKGGEKAEQLQRIHDSMMSYLHNNLPDDGTFVAMMYEFLYIRCAEEVEIDESMLTAAQLEEIALGERTIDDYKTRAVGETVEELRFYKKILNGKYADGLVMTALTPHDIENEVYVGQNISAEYSYLNNEDKKAKENNLLDELFNI